MPMRMPRGWRGEGESVKKKTDSNIQGNREKERKKKKRQGRQNDPPPTEE